MVMAGKVSEVVSRDTVSHHNYNNYRLTVLLLQFSFSISHSLNDEDTELLKPLCKELGLPIQPPVDVMVQKKAIKEDPHTGRKVEYKAVSNKNFLLCICFIKFHSRIWTN